MKICLSKPKLKDYYNPKDGPTFEYDMTSYFNDLEKYCNELEKQYNKLDKLYQSSIMENIRSLEVIKKLAKNESLKLYYLAEPDGLSYAVVWADSEDSAKKRASAKRIKLGLEFSNWEYCEEITPDVYDGILLFG